MIHYVIQRVVTGGDSPMHTEWLQRAPETAEAAGDAYVWGSEDGAAVWPVETNEQDAAVQRLAKQECGYPVVRGGRVPVRREEMPAPAVQARQARSGTRRVPPEEVFAELERRHQA